MSGWIECHGCTLVGITIVIAGSAVPAAILDQRLVDRDKLTAQPDKRIHGLANEASDLREFTVGSSERVSRNRERIDAILDQTHAADTPSPWTRPKAGIPLGAVRDEHAKTPCP